MNEQTSKQIIINKKQNINIIKLNYKSTKLQLREGPKFTFVKMENDRLAASRLYIISSLRDKHARYQLTAARDRNRGREREKKTNKQTNK